MFDDPIQSLKGVGEALSNRLEKIGIRTIGDLLKDRMGSGVVLLASALDGKVNFVATATPDIVKRGFHAGKVIKEVATVAGGGGGGRPDMAQAGGKLPEKLAESLIMGETCIREQLN